MSATVPDSTIKLYNAPAIDTQHGETLMFEDAAAREAYFASKLVSTSTPCTVVKKRVNTIKVKTPLATLEGCNYLSFINPSYGNKIFYAYILSTDYLNNDTSIVTYAIDWWLTDMFNVQFQKCQLLREGLTRGEYNKLSDSYKYKYVEKMMTPEPLNCDKYTEKPAYDIAGDNVFSFGTGAENKFDGWNVLAQQHSTYRKNGHYMRGNTETAISVSTAQVSRDYVHVLCFTAPGEDGTFRYNLQQIIFNYVEGGTIVSNKPQYPFFVYDPSKIMWYDGSTRTAGAGLSFIGRHKQVPYSASYGASLSYTNGALKDSYYARPYMMVASANMFDVQKVIDYLNQTGNVSSIIGFHEMPVTLLDEFFTCALTNAGGTVEQIDSEVFNKSYELYIPTPDRAMEMGIMPAVTSPKLKYFPFSYFTLEGTNDNSHMEYCYEFCETYSRNDNIDPYKGNNTKSIHLEKLVTVNSSGTYCGVVPYGYRGYMEDHADFGLQNLKLEDGVFYGDFPQIPYNTDAYAAFVANQAKNLMVENTREGLYEKGAQYSALQAQEMTSGVGILGSTLGALGSAFSGDIKGALSGGSASINAASAKQQAQLRIQAMDVRANMMDEAENALYGDAATLEGNAVYDNYQMARQAYVVPNYHAGSAGGILNLVGDGQRLGIICKMVTRSKFFLQEYDAFFRRYGYTTAQVKAPAIAWYVNGHRTDDVAPYFEDSDTYGNPGNEFYTQTKNCIVSNVCGDSARFIETLLDGGCVFHGSNPTV